MFGKSVRKQGGQCPDCRLETGRQVRRQKLETKRKREERDRLSAIAQATPPAHTLDGQLQRMRDRKAEERGEPAPGTVVDDDENLDDAGDELQELDADAELADVVLPSTTTRQQPYKPGHRVIVDRNTRGDSWWVGKAREHFGQAAADQRDRMEKGSEAKKVTGRINE